MTTVTMSDIINIMHISMIINLIKIFIAHNYIAGYHVEDHEPQ